MRREMGASEVRNGSATGESDFGISAIVDGGRSTVYRKDGKRIVAAGIPAIRCGKLMFKVGSNRILSTHE